MSKRLIAVLLCVSLLLTGGAFTAMADEYKPAEQVLYRVGEKAIQGLAGGIAALIPTPYSWPSEKQYLKDHDFSVNSYGFTGSDAAQAEWSVGYASRSLQTGDELTTDCYVGGSLAVGEKKLATAVLDDQKVRTVAMSDGSGITVFASLDAFGLANSEVQKIRSMLADFSAANNIKSINISTLHQHSCVDTYGMNGNLIPAIFLGGIRNLLGIKNPSGQNEAFMEHLYTAVQESVKEAVANMKPGKLFYGSINIAEYIRDKRDPQVIDPNINRLRFVPNEGGRETWLINLAIHAVGLGAGGRTVTGDYPYYMEKYINENANADFIMIQGAELAITSDYKPVDELPLDPEIQAMIDDDGYARLAVYGTELAKKACAIEDSEELTPSIKYASQPYMIKTENNVLLLIAKCGLLSVNIVRSGLGKFKIVSEVGYVEFGNRVAAVIAPGELAPEIAFGGAMDESQSWTKTSWDYPSFKDTIGSDKITLVFGLTNDQTGYMLTDNSWHSFLCENEEIVSAGPTAGSQFTTAFYALYENLPK